VRCFTRRRGIEPCGQYALHQLFKLLGNRVFEQGRTDVVRERAGTAEQSQPEQHCVCLAGTLTDAAHPRVAQDLGGKIVFSVNAGAQELHEVVCGLRNGTEQSFRTNHVDGDITSVRRACPHMTDRGGGPRLRLDRSTLRPRCYRVGRAGDRAIVPWIALAVHQL
jgi:hypothetical protein